MKITFSNIGTKHSIQLPQNIKEVEEVDIRDFTMNEPIHCAMSWYYPTLNRIAIQLHNKRVHELIKDFTDSEITYFPNQTTEQQ